MNHNNVIPFRTPHSGRELTFTDIELAALVEHFEREKIAGLQLHEEERDAVLSLIGDLTYDLGVFGERFRNVIDQLQADVALLVN